MGAGPLAGNGSSVTGATKWDHSWPGKAKGDTVQWGFPRTPETRRKLLKLTHSDTVPGREYNWVEAASLRASEAYEAIHKTEADHELPRRSPHRNDGKVELILALGEYLKNHVL